jgi:hypothetical protein
MKLDKENFAESDRTLRAPIPTEKKDGKSGRKIEAGNGTGEGIMNSACLYFR